MLFGGSAGAVYGRCLRALFGVPCGRSGCNAGAVRGAVGAVRAFGVQCGRCSRCSSRCCAGAVRGCSAGAVLHPKLHRAGLEESPADGCQGKFIRPSIRGRWPDSLKSMDWKTPGLARCPRVKAKKGKKGGRRGPHTCYGQPDVRRKLC